MASKESWLEVDRIFFAENWEQCVQKYSTQDMEAYMRDGSHNTDGQTLHNASIREKIQCNVKKENGYFYSVHHHILIQYSNNLIS